MICREPAAGLSRAASARARYNETARGSVSESNVGFRRILAILAAVSATLLAPVPGLAVDVFYKIKELNYYEWTAIAPVVVAGTSLGENGRYIEFSVSRALRGSVEDGETIRIDLKEANRNRRRSDYPQALKMPAGSDYIVVLLEPLKAKDGGLAFRMARGVRSVRELPLEAQQGLIEAVAMFLEIQDHKDDRITWLRMGQMLETANPLAVNVALEQMFKFRRGTLNDLFSLRPLFDHPDPVIREGSARLAGQIVERHGASDVPEEGALMAELIGLARRDDTVEPRVAATRALAAFGVGRVETVLDEIAESDPDQNVRLSAEKILLEYRREIEAEAAKPRLNGSSD